MRIQFNRSTFTALMLGAFAIFSCLAATGCDDNNRVPTKAEGQAADAKRQAYVDSMNLPPEVKAKMKAQMGGPAVSNPADAAKEKPKDRK